VTVGVDDTSGGVETVEDQPPADRPPPPPPPDQPGAEPEGVPSRSDSRAAAAAANQPDTSQPADVKPEPPTEPESSVSNESTAPTSQDASSDHLFDATQAASAERDAPAEPLTTDEQPSARELETEPLDGPGAPAAVDGGAEQQPSTLTASPAEDSTIDDEWMPAQPATTSEAVDHPAPADHENADVDETADPPRAEHSPLFDDLGNEPEGVPSRADSRTGAAVANSEVDENPAIGDTHVATEQTDGTTPASEIPSTPTDVHPGTNDRLSEAPPPELDVVPIVETAEQQTADDWLSAEEFAARAQSRENARAANAEQTDEPPANNTATDDPAATHDDIPAAQTLDDSRERPNLPRTEDASDTTDAGERSAKQPEAAGSDESSDPEETEIPSAQNGDRDSAPEDAIPVWTKGVEKRDELPSGEELVKMENDKLSWRERVRREGYEQVDDALDVFKQNIDTVHRLLKQPSPTGHTETTIAPEISPAPHEGVGAGDLATGSLVAGILFGEAIRWGRDRLAKMKER
jgi:hypothetical protein